MSDLHLTRGTLLYRAGSGCAPSPAQPRPQPLPELQNDAPDLAPLPSLAAPQALLSGSVKHVHALLQWRANHGLCVVTGWDLYM
jgi:hypothetical protein